MATMSGTQPPQTYHKVETASFLVSLDGFYGILWTGVALCSLACAARIYIRQKVFHKLLVDDWVMLLALALLISVAGLAQAYLKDIYMLMAVSKGEMAPGPNFSFEARRGLRSFGVSGLLTYLGIWAIKLNFLLFFRRLGTQITAFNMFWWAVFIITIACGAVSIGLMQFHCMFGPINDIMLICPQYDTIKKTYDFFKVSCIVDVVSDALIICFPMVILWHVRIDLKKKLMLCAIFSLVSFTIAVTIVRGSIFGGAYKTIDKNTQVEMNITWVWFWFYIEFSVSFIVASLVSFRALFSEREKESYDNQARMKQLALQHQTPPSSPQSSGIRKKAKQFHDSLLQSFRETETVRDMGLPTPASGRFSPTFLENVDGEHELKSKNDSTDTSSNLALHPV